MLAEDFKSDLGGIDSVKDPSNNGRDVLPNSNQSVMLPQRIRQLGTSQIRKGNSSTRAAAAQAILSNTGFNHRAQNSVLSPNGGFLSNVRQTNNLVNDKGEIVSDNSDKNTGGV